MLKLIASSKHLASRINYKTQFSNQTNYQTYPTQTKKILENGILQLSQSKTHQLEIIHKCIDELAGTRFGLHSNRILLFTFLDYTEKALKNVLLSDQPKAEQIQFQRKITLLLGIYQHIFDFQLQRWEGSQILQDWLSRQSTLQEFSQNQNSQSLLKFSNLLHQNNVDISPMREEIEQLIQNFKQNPLSTYQERLDFYLGIQSIRPLDSNEKIHLKTTLYDISKLENRTRLVEHHFLGTLAEYINLLSEVYFEKVLFETSELLDESDNERIIDDSLLEPLNKMFRLYQQQDAISYTFTLYGKAENDENLTADMIGLRDPIKWRHIAYLAKGIRILHEFQASEQSSLDLLENVIFRKLETEQVGISDAVEILLQLMHVSKVEMGPPMMILKSICDQINHQDLLELSISHLNLAKLYDILLTASHLAAEFESAFLKPALGRISAWVNQGRFDDQMKLVNWYDLQVIMKKHQFPSLDKHIEKQFLV